MTKKSNDIITFTLFPHVADPEILGEVIKFLAPKEIKKTSKVKSDFINFIRISPFVTFSFIIENHKYLFSENNEILKANILFSMNRLIDTDIPSWTAKRPHLVDYHNQLAKKIKQIIHLVSTDKKIRIIKNMFLTTSIGSVIATLFANRTKAKLFGWFSDRDEIFEVANGFVLDLFSIQFSEHLLDWDCKFVAAPAKSTDNEWYNDYTKIPDLITGALADYNIKTNKVSHDKFTPILRELVSNNDRNVFVFKLNFNYNNQVMCSRLNFRYTKT